MVQIVNIPPQRSRVTFDTASIVNAMTADVLRASKVIVLTQFSQNIPASSEEGLIWKQTTNWYKYDINGWKRQIRPAKWLELYMTMNSSCISLDNVRNGKVKTW